MPDLIANGKSQWTTTARRYPSGTWLGAAAWAVAWLSAPALVVAVTGGATAGTLPVQPVVPLAAEPFPLEQVRLLDGPFRHAMELDRDYLLSLDPDRLLHSFRELAGIPSSAKPYGGWMAPGRTSCAEFVGHYLSACALMYASTGDARLQERAARVVAGFAECQEKLGTGYLHTKPDRFTNHGEAPLGLWYQIHKLLAGLLDVEEHCGNAQALSVARRLADWAQVGADKLDDAQMQQMLAVEHGGINEALANLYARTGEAKYLYLALRFNHLEVLGPASRREDNLTGKHANTQIPKFIGAARQYELTGQGWLRTAASFFWDSVVDERSYVVGGNSIAEFFSPKERLSRALGRDTCETCNTYNMLKLTRYLFAWQPRAEYADYYERALYNHILASQNPLDGMTCYFLPLAGGPKEFATPEDSFWCCTGTGVENHARYGESIYFRRERAELFVNLFVASELRWPAAGLTLRQETDFPTQGHSRLSFDCERPVELSCAIRHPYWATAGFELHVNGQRQTVDSRPGSYAVLTRRWQRGDTVEVTMPLCLRMEGFRDDPQRVAVLYGPLVLCAQSDAARLAVAPFPAIVAEPSRLLAALAPVPGKPATFRGDATVLRPSDWDDEGATLEPIHAVYGRRGYVVYWNALTEQQWQDATARLLAARARTVDQVLPGNEQNEREHRLAGERTGTDRQSWRHAVNGGWFSWHVRTVPGQAHELRVKYWGGDTGGRDFDVLVDGTLVASERLDNNRPGEFFEQAYAIPERATHGKDGVTIRFQGRGGAMAGGVFGCAILTRAAVAE